MGRALGGQWLGNEIADHAMQKKRYKAYVLHFTSPLHIGNAREDYGSCQKTVASDSMYAALTSTLAEVGHPLPADGDLGCVISSLFPFREMDEQRERVYFFPRPFSPVHPRTENPADNKLLKKVKWVDSYWLQKLLKGDGMPTRTDQMKSIHGEYLTRGYWKEDFIISAEMQRVAIAARDRSEPPMPFYMDKVLFRGRSGLFFLCEGDTSLVDAAMPILQQSGLGTDKAVGNGAFEYEVDEIDLEVPNEATAAMCLSVYIPSSKAELEAGLSHPAAAYTLSRRGGWIASQEKMLLRKRAIYALAEGSVLARQAECDVAGRIVDLNPSEALVEHPVWRCGKALFLPLKA